MLTEIIYQVSYVFDLNAKDLIMSCKKIYEK